MSDEKDRLGQRLHDVEVAREDQWARSRDAELLERVRERLNAMLCPYCKASLGAASENGVDMAEVRQRSRRLARQENAHTIPPEAQMNPPDGVRFFLELD